MRRVFAEDEMARHIEVHILYHIADYVDTAGIGGQLLQLPGEILI